jgi:hypothetical protein
MQPMVGVPRMDRSRGLRNAWITIHSSGANEPIGICKVFHCGLGPLGDLCRCKKALAKLGPVFLEL